MDKLVMPRMHRTLTPRVLFNTFLPDYMFKKGTPTDKDPRDVMATKVPADISDFNNRSLKKKRAFTKTLKQEFGGGLEEKMVPSSLQKRPKGSIWCITNGHWVLADMCTAVPLFPWVLGPAIHSFVMGTQLASTGLLGPSNGLILPKNVALAFDEWALTLTPSQPLTPEQVSANTLVQRWTLRITIPDHPVMRERVFRAQVPQYDDNKRKVADLDGRQLSMLPFRRDRIMHLYFNNCCVVWRTLYRAIPDIDAEDPRAFWDRFLAIMGATWGHEFTRAAAITQVFDPTTPLVQERARAAAEKFRNHSLKYMQKTPAQQMEADAEAA